MPPARSRACTSRLTACRAHPVCRSTSPGMQAPRCSIVRPAADDGGGLVGDVDRGGQHPGVPPPDGAATSATTVPASSSTSAAVLVPPMSMPSLTGHLTTDTGRPGRAPRRGAAEGLDVGTAARPAALDEHDVVARTAQPLHDRGAGCDASTARPTTATLAPGGHLRLGDRRAERRRAPRDVADGEVGGAGDLHERHRAAGGQPGRGPAVEAEGAGHGRVRQGPRRRRRTRAGAGIRSAVAVARARTRAAASATRSSGSRPASHGGDDGGVHGLVGLLGGGRAEAEQVDPGRQGAYRGLRDAGLGARAGHVERVADDDPVEAELVAQHADHGARERGRAVRVEGGDDDVRGHDGGDAGSRRPPGTGPARARAAPRRSRRRAAGRGASRPRCHRGRGSAWRRRRPPSTAGPRPRPRCGARRGRGRRRSCARR